MCLLQLVHQPPAWGSKPQANQLTMYRRREHCTECLAHFINSIEIDADQCIQGQLSDLHGQIDELKDSLHDVKKSYHNTEAVLTKEHS